MSNPFNDKINKAVAEAARKVMEQTKEAEQIEERAKWRSSSAAKPDSDNDWDRSPKSTGGMRASSDKRGDTGGEYNHSSLENRKKAQVVAKTGKTTKASNTSLKGRIRSNLANKQSKPNLPEEFEQMDEELQVGQKVHVSGITGKHTGVIKKIRSASDGNQYFVKHDDSAILKSYPRHKISVKEEVEQMSEEYVIHKGKHEPGRVSSLGGQTLHGVTVKDVYKDKKEAQAHADAINKGRGYKAGDEKNSLYGGVLYQVSPRKSMKEETEQTEEGYRPHHTNPKPGWALDPATKAKFAEIERKRATKAKYVGKSIPKSDKMEEEAKHYTHQVTLYSKDQATGKPVDKVTFRVKAENEKDAVKQTKKLAKKQYPDGAHKHVWNTRELNMKEESGFTSQIAERLIGKQHKIDANKNGKVDAHDFKLLRKKTKAMKESVEPLTEEATPALSAAMKAILADAFHMYFKAHTFHWNVEGANFPEYHKFFGDVYEQLFDTIDPIAEEIRALGEYAPRSLTELKGSTSIDDSSVQTPAEMFGSLLADNSKILAGLTNGYKVAEAAGEIGLSNFLQDKIDAHKKLGWMIKSVSKGA